VSLPARAGTGAGAGKKTFEAGFLLTHRGLSGPSILQISSYWTPGEEISIDFLPGKDLRGWLRERRRDRPTAELKNLLGEVLPKRLAQLFCELPPGEGFENRQMRLFSDAEIEMLAARLAAWKFRPDGSEGWRKAEVTLGGVDTRELSSTTMESKKVPGLFFIGEVVDVTGHLGGFNFQWAWASGHAAGEVV
jgi:predicted Rossmann fold flavoprotein